MFTEFGVDDRNIIPNTMMTRVSETLRKNLSEQQFKAISIKFQSVSGGMESRYTPKTERSDSVSRPRAVGITQESSSA